MQSRSCFRGVFAAVETIIHLSTDNSYPFLSRTLEKDWKLSGFIEFNRMKHFHVGRVTVENVSPVTISCFFSGSIMSSEKSWANSFQNVLK